VFSHTCFLTRVFSHVFSCALSTLDLQYASSLNSSSRWPFLSPYARVHDQRVVHGSGPNSSPGWRRAYVLAFRTAEMVREERRLGFSHSHNDTFKWDAFHAWKVAVDGEA